MRLIDKNNRFFMCTVSPIGGKTNDFKGLDDILSL